MADMRRYWGLVVGFLLLLAVPLAAAAAEAGEGGFDAEAVGAWQHHRGEFYYYGYTSHYTCNGLEGKVRAILIHLGARQDLHVTASGCARGPNDISRSATVYADFYSLAPTSEPGGKDAVKGRWIAVEVTPRHPSFMGDGDCELVERMQDLIAKGFSLRDLNYRTECVPHDINTNAFGIRAQALKAAAKLSVAKG
jgi:hypothetical protein